jgi:hypothetical protein
LFALICRAAETIASDAVKSREEFHTRKIICRSGGLKFAMVSFNARAVPALPIPLQQPLLVTQIAGGGGSGWHRSPYGAEELGTRRATTAGSGQRPTGHATSAAGAGG